MLETNLDFWSIESRDSFDFDNAIEINLWNRKRNEQAIELEGTVDAKSGKVLEIIETQGYPEIEVKKLLINAWMKTLSGVTMHTTEPNRGYFLYRDNPSKTNGGFSSPFTHSTFEEDLEWFIDLLKDTKLKKYL